MKRLISFLLILALVLSIGPIGTLAAADKTPASNNTVMLNNGLNVRWLNNAGFEMVLPSGKHLLVDPWLDKANNYPISVDAIEKCDYVLLSHVHGDHAADVKTLQDKFKRFVLVVGDFGADPLAQEQDIDLRNIYRVRDGAKLTFDDVTIEVFGTRHTEPNMPSLRSKSFKEGTPNTGWWGSFEVLSYLITTSDGTKVLIWAGMTTEEQKNLFKDLHPDIAFMHLSPKSDAKVFAQMVASWGPKLVIPHHYDGIAANARSNPAGLDQNMSKEYQDMFMKNGEFQTDLFVGYFRNWIEKLSPTSTMMELEHHKWYHFGMGYSILEQ